MMAPASTNPAPWRIITRMQVKPLNFIRRCPLAISLAATLLTTPGVAGVTVAATVYKTVDENGVVSYSDVQPREDVPVEILELEVRAPEISATEQQRLEAMRETTDRMVADRQQRELHRAELRRQRAQQSARQESPNEQSDYPDYLGYPGGYPVYYPYPVRRPGAGWHKPRPVHPVAPVPLRPGSVGKTRGATPKLPGNDYPASLVRKHYSPPVRAAFTR